MMSKAMTWSIVVLMASVWSPTHLQTQGRSSDEQRVRALDDQERAARLARDTAALNGLWSEQVTVNAPNNQVVVGRQAVLETFVRTSILEFSSFERDVEFIRVDGEFVFIMGLETLVPKRDAPSAGLVAGQEMKRRFTNIWKREGNTWRLFARHAHVIAQSR